MAFICPVRGFVGQGGDRDGGEIKCLKTQIKQSFYFVGYYYIKIKKLFIFIEKDLDGE